MTPPATPPAAPPPAAPITPAALVRPGHRTDEPVEHPRNLLAPHPQDLKLDFELQVPPQDQHVPQRLQRRLRQVVIVRLVPRPPPLETLRDRLRHLNGSL